MKCNLKLPFRSSRVQSQISACSLIFCCFICLYIVITIYQIFIMLLLSFISFTYPLSVLRYMIFLLWPLFFLILTTKFWQNLHTFYSVSKIDLFLFLKSMNILRCTYAWRLFNIESYLKFVMYQTMYHTWYWLCIRTMFHTLYCFCFQ